MVDKAVYTIDEVAKMFDVTPRVVHRWFDNGLIKGYTIPGTQARRIPHKRLEEFKFRYNVRREGDAARRVSQNVQLGDTIRIDCGDGQFLTVVASDMVEYVRRFGQAERFKSCPNDECAGGWAPDRLKTGKNICPVCKTEWT